jgi:hypothetical protein
MHFPEGEPFLNRPYKLNRICLPDKLKIFNFEPALPLAMQFPEGELF